MNNAPKRLFGTDGIRDKANSGALTVENVVRVAKAAGVLLRKRRGIFRERLGLRNPAGVVGGKFQPRRRTGHPMVIIGSDTRLSSPLIACALRSGLLAGGIDVFDAGVVGTPGLAYLSSALRFDLGIMISASHNPMGDNGIKFFSNQGLKISDVSELAVERLVLSGRLDRDEGPTDDRIGSAEEYGLGRQLYCRRVLQIAGDLRLTGMRIVLDCANGATYRAAPEIFAQLGASVHAVNAAPNGVNINRGCGALHPEEVAASVKRHAAHIGFAFDGDGDRVIVADETGVVRDGDYVLAIAARHMKKRGALTNNTVVTTVMANLGLERSLVAAGIRMRRTNVGDRLVVQEMLRGGFVLGGEQSGHIVFLKHSPTGDGLVTAVQLLKIMAREDSPLSALADCMTKFPQVLENVRVREKPPFNSVALIAKAVQHVKRRLGDSGRLLLRYSGTEPLARIMIEGPDAREINELAQMLRLVIERKIGAGA
ncbi:MAG: phosphoglucosamine mutase [Planctomycetota bacterium]|nr:phosphoglucosamine mutase [Planctomycetota bacterium]